MTEDYLPLGQAPTNKENVEIISLHDPKYLRINYLKQDIEILDKLIEQETFDEQLKHWQDIKRKREQEIVELEKQLYKNTTTQ